MYPPPGRSCWPGGPVGRASARGPIEGAGAVAWEAPRPPVALWTFLSAYALRRRSLWSASWRRQLWAVPSKSGHGWKLGGAVVRGDASLEQNQDHQEAYVPPALLAEALLQAVVQDLRQAEHGSATAVGRRPGWRALPARLNIYELADVGGHGVAEAVRSRVEVDDVHGAAYAGTVLLNLVAERGLRTHARARRVVSCQGAAAQ